eukprot:354186-Chlamydomonas_euryale.AAC.2
MNVTASQPVPPHPDAAPHLSYLHTSHGSTPSPVHLQASGTSTAAAGMRKGSSGTASLHTAAWSLGWWRPSRRRWHRQGNCPEAAACHVHAWRGLCAGLDPGFAPYRMHTPCTLLLSLDQSTAVQTLVPLSDARLSLVTAAPSSVAGDAVVRN